MVRRKPISNNASSAVRLPRADDSHRNVTTFMIAHLITALYRGLLEEPAPEPLSAALSGASETVNSRPRGRVHARLRAVTKKNPARGRAPIDKTIMSIITSADQRLGSWSRFGAVALIDQLAYTRLRLREKYQMAAATMTTRTTTHQ
jgi:hypothetical protein